MSLATSACVQVFGCRHAETIPTLGQPASENLHNNGSHSKQAMPSRATDRASPRLHFRADLRDQKEGCPDDRDPSDRGVAPARRPEADRSRGAYRTRCCLRRLARNEMALGISEDRICKAENPLMRVRVWVVS